MLCRIAVTIIFLTLLLSVVRAQTNQNNSEPDYWHNRNLLERLGTSPLTSGNIPALNNRTTEIKGDVYLTKYFNPTIFRLYQNEQLIEGLKSKLDLQKNEFDVKTSTGIMALPGNKIKDLIFLDSATKKSRIFVNAKDYPTEKGVPLLGFYEVVSSGNLSLVHHHRMTLKADYHPTLIPGGKEYRFFYKYDVYYIKDAIVRSLPPKKKRFLLFERKPKEMSDFILKNKIDLGDDKELKEAFDYYNQLLKEEQN